MNTARLGRYRVVRSSRHDTIKVAELNGGVEAEEIVGGCRED